MKLRLLFYYFAALIYPFLSSGCLQNQKKRSPKLQKNLLIRRAYLFNRFLRWQYPERAKDFVEPKKRFDFVANWENSSGEVQIVEFKIGEAQIDPKKKEGKVLIVRKQFSKNVGLLQKLLFIQYWKSDEKGIWYFVRERRFKKAIRGGESNPKKRAQN